MKILHGKTPATWKQGCTGKIRYGKRAQAEPVLDLMRAKVPDKAFTIYKCRHCNSYHVGSVET